MIMHPDGRLEGTPQEMAQYQQLMQLKPYVQSTPNVQWSSPVIRPLAAKGSGSIDGLPPDSYTSWN